MKNGETKGYVIMNEKGHYLKVRRGTSGARRSWVKSLKGATVGTLKQCEAMKDGLKESPYYKGLKLIKIGEGNSLWEIKAMMNDKN